MQIMISYTSVLVSYNRGVPHFRAIILQKLSKIVGLYPEICHFRFFRKQVNKPIDARAKLIIRQSKLIVRKSKLIVRQSLVKDTQRHYQDEN